MFCFTTFSVYQTNDVMIGEGNGRGLIKVVTRYLFDWLGKVTINVRTDCIQAVTGLERYCYSSMSGRILMYHWLFVPVSCAAHALQTTAGGTLGHDCHLCLQFGCSYMHTRLSSTSAPEGSVQVEGCPSRNWLFSYVLLYKYREESLVEIQTPALYNLIGRSVIALATLGIAQQYFLAFFLTFLFHSHKENPGACFKNVLYYTKIVTTERDLDPNHPPPPPPTPPPPPPPPPPAGTFTKTED